MEFVLTSFLIKFNALQSLQVIIVGAVKDQMIDQGVALCTSTEVEPTCAYFQGPQRVASEHNQITGSDVWGIFDFHNDLLLLLVMILVYE